jgi:ankyrin repeat protein
MACYGGDETMVRLLLDHGADIESCDVDGDTPLILARRGGHRSLVLTLEQELETRTRKTAEEYDFPESRYASLSVGFFRFGTKKRVSPVLCLSMTRHQYLSNQLSKPATVLKPTNFNAKKPKNQSLM